METADVIIIGAGITGLTVARKLSRKGKRVVVLEARNRMGGRIHTIHDAAAGEYHEAGAEFIHGKLPNTLRMLNEYGISYSLVKGEILQVRNGTAQRSTDIISTYKKTLRKKLLGLQRDMTVKQFLDLHFAGTVYEQLRSDVMRFVEGYDAGDIEHASVFAFRDEWSLIDDWKQYRVDDGYGALIDALGDDCRNNGVNIRLSCDVRMIRWNAHDVQITCSSGEPFRASSVVITTPLGVLQSGSMQFIPELPGRKLAWSKLKMGSVVKLHLFFSEPFWKSELCRKHLDLDTEKLSFVISDAPVPTWWTQYPAPGAMLTGWLPGPKAVRYSASSHEEILHEALRSLCYIFGESEEHLRSLLTGSNIYNWHTDPFSRGAYHYDTVDADYYAQLAGEPVDGRIFFAGETFGGEEGAGLVEAAITSALRTANLILAERNKDAA